MHLFFWLTFVLPSETILKCFQSTINRKIHCKAVSSHKYDASNSKKHLMTFDLCNLHKNHFLECRQARYCSAKDTDQCLAYNFALTLRPPKSDF